jgi:hypothetical protein
LGKFERCFFLATTHILGTPVTATVRLWSQSEHLQGLRGSRTVFLTSIAAEITRTMVESTSSDSSQNTQLLLSDPDENAATDRHKQGYLLPEFATLRDMKSLVIMSTSYTVAVIVAIAQHCFYRTLDGKDLESFVIPQKWVPQISTALIFLFKTTIVAAVGIAYAQAFWNRVRGPALRIVGLDAMFCVLRNPFQFFNVDLLLRAKVLLILAIVSWTLPIAVVFAPGALTGQHLTFCCLPNSGH